MRLQTRAFAVASGFLAAAAIFLLTLLLLVAGTARGPLPVLQGLLFGYSVSVQGAFIGAMWAYAYGFLLGAAFAFVYNISVVPPAPPPFDDVREAGEEG